METALDGGGTWNWATIPKGSGVLAIRRKSDGKSYFVGVRDLRQRAYDHHRLLVAGRHHNRVLQAAWAAATPEDFEFVAVERGIDPDLLPAFAQTWLARSNNNCFNRRSPLRRVRRPSRP